MSLFTMPALTLVVQPPPPVGHSCPTWHQVGQNVLVLGARVPLWHGAGGAHGVGLAPLLQGATPAREQLCLRGPLALQRVGPGQAVPRVWLYRVLNGNNSTIGGGKWGPSRLICLKNSS